MKETILKLKTMLAADRFILTGSYALAKYGLRSNMDINDIDIILIKPTIGTCETINRFMKEFPAKSTAKIKPIPIPNEVEPLMPAGTKPYKSSVQPSCLMAIFMFDRFKIDIYIQEYFDEPILNIDGIEHTTIPHIVKAKQSYGRMKDWLQLREMSRVFFKPEEFTNILNNEWRATLREEY